MLYFLPMRGRPKTVETKEEEEERVGQAEADRQADRHGDLD